jgi:AhpC/TSA family
MLLAVAVFIFVRADCPISNRYAPEIQRLYREFSPRGVAFSIVYPAPGEARHHAKEYGLPGSIVLDPEHKLAKKADIHTTPEAAVFVEDRLVYHGRIDDRYLSLSKARANATTHDLEAAVAAALDGKPVPQASGPAVGCAIE